MEKKVTLDDYEVVILDKALNYYTCICSVDLVDHPDPNDPERCGLEEMIVRAQQLQRRVEQTTFTEEN